MNRKSKRKMADEVQKLLKKLTKYVYKASQIENTLNLVLDLPERHDPNKAVQTVLEKYKAVSGIGDKTPESIVAAANRPILNESDKIGSVPLLRF